MKKNKQGPLVLTLLWTANAAFDGINTVSTQSIASGGSAALNTDCGVLTLTGANAAAGATNTFTLTNSHCAATSVVLVTLMDYAGTYHTNGQPQVLKAVPGAGSFVITIGNSDAANALSGNIKVAFRVVNLVQ